MIKVTNRKSEKPMISEQEILIRLTLACLYGALIGLERERKDWTAGLRTHMMVCVGSCLIMLVSAYGFNDVLNTDGIVLDPSRVAAQVVSGIGFIGAGTILFLRKGIIRGLTTAAGLWTVAAIGLATGAGMYFAAGATTIIALVILWALKPLERWYSRQFRHDSLRIVTHGNVESNKILDKFLTHKSINIKSMTFDRNDANELVYQIRFEKSSNKLIKNIVTEMETNSDVIEIMWTR